MLLAKKRYFFFLVRTAVFQNSEKKCHFLTQDFTRSCFVQGGAGTTFRPAITEARPPRPGLELMDLVAVSPHAVQIAAENKP